MKFIKKMFNNENGATAIEYGLIAALISVAAMVSIQSVGADVDATFDEIADQLAISSNTVKSRFYSALDKLRVQLEDHDVEQSASF